MSAEGVSPEVVGPRSTRALARFFARWGNAVAQTPRRILLATLAFGALLIAPLPGLRIDTSFESFLAGDHPTRVVLDRFRERYGRTEPIVVAVRVREGIANPDFIRRLRALHEDLASSVPHLRRIRSLVNVRHTEARGDALHVGELLAEPLETAADRRRFEARVRGFPLYRNYLIGELDDAGRGRIGWTSIALEAERFAEATIDEASGFDDASSSGRPLAREDDVAMVKAVREILDAHRRPDFDFALAGSLVVDETVGNAVEADLGRLLALATLLIALLLALILRGAGIVALVLGVVLFALSGSLGAMTALGFPFGFGTQILPAFLLATGVGYAIHLVVRFRHEFERARSRRFAVAAAVAHTGTPIALTALTTLLGMVSFVAVDLIPIVHIGYFAPFGILLTAFFSLTLLPALLTLLPARFTVRATEPRVRAHRAGAVARLGLGATRQPELVLLGLAIVIGVAAIGITRIETRHDALRWLSPEHRVRQDTALVDEALGGASLFELVFEARPGRDFREPELLRRLDRIEQRIVALDDPHVRVGMVMGLHDVVKEQNEALHGDDPSAHHIPADPALVAQELLLFESSGLDDLEQLADRGYESTRMTVRVNRVDAFYSVPFSERVSAIARDEMQGVASVALTGLYDLKTAVFVNVIDSLVTTYGIAIVTVLGLVLVVTADLRIGLACLLPNLLPLAVALGFMGIAGVPLGVYTLLVGSIALGLAADDTIHLAHAFQSRIRAGDDTRDALEHALETSGVAILFTSAALVCGFLVFFFASLSTLWHFGLVSAIAIGAAWCADVVLLPVLLQAAVEKRLTPGAIANWLRTRRRADEARAAKPDPPPAREGRRSRPLARCSRSPRAMAECTSPAGSREA